MERFEPITRVWHVCVETPTVTVVGLLRVTRTARTVASGLPMVAVTTQCGARKRTRSEKSNCIRNGWSYEILKYHKGQEVNG